MEIKEFYKELYAKLNEILKPYGFRKKGDSFRRILDNGIVWEIEMQRNEFKRALMYQFTANIYIGLSTVPVPLDIWKKNKSQIDGNLGEKLDEKWDHQKWYNLSAMVNPQVKAQIRDGKLPLRYQEPGKEWQTKWIPCQTFDEIIAEMCRLVEHKALPLYLSVQTLDGYMELLETGSEKGFMISKSIGNARLYAEIFGQRFLPLLSEWIKDAHNYLEYKISQDMSQYDDFYIQSHEESIIAQREHIAALEEIEKQLKER